MALRIIFTLALMLAAPLAPVPRVMAGIDSGSACKSC